MKQILFIILILNINIIHSQNLISDPNFESYPQQKGYWTIDDLTKWKNPTKASPDLYSDYIIGENRLKRKTVNNEKKSHIGVITFLGLYNTGKYENYREYLTSRILSKLKKDSIYCISIIIKRKVDRYDLANEIGALFTENEPKQRNMHVLKVNNPINCIYIVGDTIITNSNDWTTICSEYKAQGNEEYITIGNFYTNQKSKYIVSPLKKNKKRNIIKEAYYYIDNVSLYKTDEENKCNCKKKKEELIVSKDTIIFNKEQITEGKTIVLNNVYFNSSKSVLLPKSDNELNLLSKFLKENDNVKIEISGHTDNTGIEQKNIELSEARAKAVVNYLILQGVNKENITFVGYGSSKPISDNKTEEGKAKNRRVEFKVLSK